MRTSDISRVTAETDIRLSLDLDGSGTSEIDTGVGFLDHMLTLFARHARFDLYVKAKGDVYVDDHHTVEDVGIVLGQAFAEAVGDKKGIVRFGDLTILSRCLRSLKASSSMLITGIPLYSASITGRVPVP